MPPMQKILMVDLNLLLDQKPAMKRILRLVQNLPPNQEASYENDPNSGTKSTTRSKASYE